MELFSRVNENILLEKMLWEKESDGKDAVYVDLLESPSINKFFKLYEQEKSLMQVKYEPEFEKSTAVASEYRQNGNEFFSEKEWVQATAFYNRSMCFANEGSTEMGLAYANRASCFFNMKMYSKCLIDIEHAKQNRYPEEKMTKLDERRTICLSMMEKEADQSELFEPKLDYPPDEKFPCMANVLKIENNRKYGRHIVAKEEIDVGKTVMVDQVYLGTNLQKYQRCCICLRQADNLKPCKKCTFTLVCPKCEENNLHEIECDINPVFFGTLAFHSYRMVIVRSILLAMQTFPEIDQLIAVVENMLSSNAVEVPDSLSDPQSKYRAFFKLQPNPNDHNERFLPQKIYLIHRLLMGIPNVVRFFHSKSHMRFLIHLIGHHIVVIKNWVRNDRYKTGQKGILGEDIEVFLEHRLSIPSSYFNHSCVPNAHITSQNGINVCVVVRPVKKGEQLFVTYDNKVLINESKAERQELLRSKFNFECYCDRCAKPEIESLCRKSSQSIKSDPNFQAYFEDMSCSPNYQNILSLKAQIFGLLKKYKKLGWSMEMLSIIYLLYSVSLIEIEHGAGPELFTGRILNEHDD